jgi:hypothetical protein
MIYGRVIVAVGFPGRLPHRCRSGTKGREAWTFVHASLATAASPAVSGRPRYVLILLL